MKFNMVKASEFCDSVRDGTHDSPKRVNKGYKLITSKHIKEYGLDLENAYYISEKDFNKINERSLVEKNDILYSMIGTVGLIHRIDYEPNYAIKNIGLFKLKDEIKSKWLYYYLKSPKMKSYINSLLSGSTQQYITLNNLRNLPIAIPENYIDMIKIIKILELLEKKININAQTNNNLEELAYTIFLHDFANKTANGTIGDIIKENEKSKIKVGDAKDIKGEYPFFTSGESILEWNDYLTDGRNLFLNTGGNADVKFYVGKATYSTDTWCITFKNEMSDYLYLYLKAIKNELDRKFFHGSGLKHLQKPLFKQEKIYIPKQEELRRFNIQVKTMFDTISSNKRENQRLNSLKEYLLPLLMNGQINVDDIEI